MVRLNWVHKIESAWKEKSIVWLMGVRRSGKTTLAKSIEHMQYFDCELPRVRNQLKDPEDFFLNLKSKICVLDEIHRIENASEVLKIAADHFPKIKILATGSSTLAASKRFKDTLTGRKRTVFLTPINFEDQKNFKNESLNHRFLRGGLPPMFISKSYPEEDFKEWVDSFWAKDIQELFNIEKKSAFLKFFELVALQSGGLFVAQNFSAPCGVSHTTIANYLNVMDQTQTAYVIRPFHNNKAKEIITAAKVYFFDTGFINYFMGLTSNNEIQKGHLWEHFILNELLSHFDKEDIHYWRDKAKHEIDFVIKKRGRFPMAIECKWNQSEFQTKNLKAFRAIHKDGVNVLIASDIQRIRTKNISGFDVVLYPLNKIDQLLELIK